MQVVLPLALNTTVDCKWRDLDFRLAKVVERRPRAEKPEEYEYYVHYDRRKPLQPRRITAPVAVVISLT